MVDVSKIRTDWEDVSEADWQVNSARAQANRLTAEPLNALGLGVIEALSQGGGGGGGGPVTAADVDSETATGGHVLTADGSGGAAWEAVPGGGGGGVTDHGNLTGLGDDDHPQYHTDARGDARYVPLGRTVNSKPLSADVTLDAPDVGAAPAEHTHAAADVTSGTFNVARIPTGTTGASVALGNHSHTPASIGAATAAQGGLADSAVQPGDDAATLGSGSATSGRVLTADGSGATSWQEAAGGGGGGYSPPVGAVGSWIGPSAVGLMNANGTVGVWGTDSAIMCPIVIGREITVDALGFMGGGESGLSTRVLLYAPGESGMPSALVATATVSVSGGSLNMVAVLGSPVVLPPGLYWGTIRSNGGTTDTYKAINNGQLALPVTFSDTPSATRPAVPLVNVGTFASPAASVTSFTWHSSNSNLIPQVWLRRSA